MTYVRLHAGKLILGKESASDIVQSACREVLEDLAAFEYRGESAFRQWLFKATLNKIHERGRRHRALKRDARREQQGPFDEDIDKLLPSFTTPSQVAIAEETMGRLEKAFAQLPDDYRRVITAAKLLGQTHVEIAEDMGRSKTAVRVLLHRALFRLGFLMEQAGGQDSLSDR